MAENFKLYEILTLASKLRNQSNCVRKKAAAQQALMIPYVFVFSQLRHPPPYQTRTFCT